MKEAAVIILNWNGENFLREYLPKVIANTSQDIADIIVADNGSTDGSLKLLEQEFPGVQVIRFSENHGFAEGYNKAISATQYPYTVLLNSDVAPEKGWLEPLYRHMSAHPDTVACQPKIKALTDPDRFEYAGACGGFLDINGFPYCRGRIFDTVEEDRGQYDTTLEVFWASGAALMVRTDAYIEAGGLDPSFFAHMEEIDLCWRMKLRGGKIYAIPEGTVYHLGGGTLPSSSPKKTYLNFRNNLLMLYKNLPAEQRKRRLIIRRLYDTIALVKYAITFDFKNAKSIWKAHMDFRKMRRAPENSPKRNLIASGCNIIVDYYLRGKKKYSQL